MSKLKAILIGAGSRGTVYTNIMHRGTGDFEVVAVAEPIEEKRKYIAEKHGIPEDMCFNSWEPVFEKEKFADVALICTLDRDHFAPAMAAIEKGYNLLLEKPIAPTPEECIAIKNVALKKGVKILVCHVLRYTALFSKIKELVDNGTVGDIISIEHDECVGNVHQSHSFVRGNWGNSEKSSPMLLQKSCHDMDILQWIIGKKCTRIHSFGSLTYFRKENAPAGAPDYCIDGCPHADTCYYNAVKLYYNDKNNSWFRTVATGNPSPTDDDVEKALRTTQFGKCVFKCDNNVVDHQVVNMEFEGGVLANFNMCAFNKSCRHTRIMGTKGELVANADSKMLEFFDFATREVTEIDTKATSTGSTLVSGHGGGDSGIIISLGEYLRDECSADALSEISISADNHMIVFAAEQSRHTGSVVDVKEFVSSYDK